MNYKSLNKLFTLCLLLLCSFFSIGQELAGDKLIEYIKVYDTFETNEERDAHLRKVHDLVAEIPKDSIDFVLNIYEDNFIARLAMADYLRSAKDYKNAKKAYTKLEEDVLKKQPVDYTILSTICWKSSQNSSLKNFNFENAIKELNNGLAYAEKSKVVSRIISYHSNLSIYYTSSASYEQSIYHNKKHYDVAKNGNDSIQMILALRKIMLDFTKTKNGESAIKIWHQIQPMFKKKQHEYPNSSQLLTEVTNAYILSKQLDSARYYNARCFQIDSVVGNLNRHCLNTLNKGKILMELGKMEEAETALLSSYNLSKEYRNRRVQVVSPTYLAQVYIQLNQPDKALKWLRPSYKKSLRLRGYHKAGIELNLSKAFEATHVLDSALYYRNKSDKSLVLENRGITKIQVALTKAELDINELLKKNTNLNSSNQELDGLVTSTKKTNKYLIMSAILVCLLIGLFIYNRNQKEKLRTSLYKEQIVNKENIAIEAELSAIRSQMNPHFMFNSLNSINEFIQNDNSEEASDYLVKFSRLMRSTLNYSKKKFVTLKEESELLSLYVELENLRFYNSIDFNLHIDENIDIELVKIPPMILQPFLENSIWHGLMSKTNDRKLSLRFKEESDYIKCEIEDNGIGRKASEDQKKQNRGHKSQGVGLTERRLELLKTIHGIEAGIKIIDKEENGKALGTLVEIQLPKYDAV